MTAMNLKYMTAGALIAAPLIASAGPSGTVRLDITPPTQVRQALHVGHANPNAVLHLAISIPFANQNAVEQFVKDVSNPTSPNYRHFLTPEQVGAQFGLSVSEVNKVASFLRSEGMDVKLVGKNRLSILADATVSQAEHAFGTSIETYASTKQADAQDPYRYSFTGTLSVPKAIGKSVLNVSGLEDFTRPQKRYLTPSQARTLYGAATLYAGGAQGQGRTIGISNWDGFRLSNAVSFISYYGLPVPAAGATSNVTVTKIDGGTGTGTQNVEGDLDIQCTLAVAPLASVIIYDGFGGDLINVLTKEVNDNSADIITESYGWSLGASTADAAHTLHLSMSAQGITYLAASGDSGTSIGTYSYPDFEPEVLIVGGTTVATDTSGNRTTETGWSGSGGGWVPTATNTFNVKPAYQSKVGPTGVNYRLSPDIAADADPTTGYTLYLTAGTYPGFTLSTSGVYGGFGGTSAASPTLAAALADAEQQMIANGGLAANSAGKRRLGRVNDLLYGLLGNTSVFFDVTSGSNGSLPNGSTSTAGAGWDTVTGLGALNFQGLVNQVAPSTLKISSLTLSPTTTEGGNGTAVTGTVTLSAAAPTGGTVVTLASSNAAVSVPASVTVAAGATSATFSGKTIAVATSTSVTLTASISGRSTTAVETVTAPRTTSLSLSSSSVVGGTAVTGTIKIAEAAPTGGLVVNLTSSNTAAATVPATATIAAGATSGTFTITTLVVSANASTTLTASSGGASATAALAVTAPTVKSLTLSSTSLVGGNGTVITGTVTLTGAAPSAGTSVSVTSSSTSVTLSGASITVAAGKTTGTFTLTAAAVSATTNVTITAATGTVSSTATLSITPAVLSSIALSASSVVGGVTNPTATITLSGPAGPSGTVVTVASSASTAASFASTTITVPAGSKTATAIVTTYPVNANTSVTLTATSSVSKTALLTVTAPALSALSLSATTIQGNGTNVVTGTVTLTGAAGSSGVVVTLKSSNATICPVPASVTVAAGSKTGTFTFKPTKPTANTTVTITATFGTTSKTATITVTP